MWVFEPSCGVCAEERDRVCCVCWRCVCVCVCVCVCTFSSLRSSFLTDLRLDLRSMVPLCLEPSSALIISSAETRTFLRGGFLNLPPRSITFIFSSVPVLTHTHTHTPLSHTFTHTHL